MISVFSHLKFISMKRMTLWQFRKNIMTLRNKVNAISLIIIVLIIRVTILFLLIILMFVTETLWSSNVNISNTGSLCFRLSTIYVKVNVKGEQLFPARILLIDLNATKVYVYNSADYIDDIQKVYIGATSKGNDAFFKRMYILLLNMIIWIW